MSETSSGHTSEPQPEGEINNTVFKALHSQLLESQRVRGSEDMKWDSDWKNSGDEFAHHPEEDYPMGRISYSADGVV